MKESDIVRIIKSEALKHGILLSKCNTGPFGEISASDLYGVMKDGRAIFVEVKVPGYRKDQRVLNQLHWLEKRRELGAFTAIVDSWGQLADMLKAEGYLVDNPNQNAQK